MAEIDIKKLTQLAWSASEKAYCPYSKYKVGAAVLGEDGVIYTGCNIENASYGLTNCAERTAIFKMVSEGCMHFEAIVVAAGDTAKGSSPCGACRQVIVEFCKNLDTPVILVGKDKSVLEFTAGTILPAAFLRSDLIDE